MGHEAVAEVVEVGDLVTRFKPGDKVVVPCTTPDWASKPNLQEKGTNNAHDFDVMTSFKFLIQEDGVFAERFRETTLTTTWYCSLKEWNWQTH